MADVVAVMRRYRLLPAIFFMKSRADCDQALRLYAQSATQLPLARKAQLAEQIEQLTWQSELLSDHRPIGAHHGGQLPAWKLTLEKLMTQGLLEVVFATSVNFPARTIVMLNSDRFNGTEFVPLDATELHQMTGRAGRRGKDNIGFALTLPGKYMDLGRVANLFQQPPANVDSQIKVSFSMVLNLLLSHSPEQVEGLYEHAFAAWQIRHRQTETTDGVRSLGICDDIRPFYKRMATSTRKASRQRWGFGPPGCALINPCSLPRGCVTSVFLRGSPPCWPRLSPLWSMIATPSGDAPSRAWPSPLKPPCLRW